MPSTAPGWGSGSSVELPPFTRPDFATLYNPANGTGDLTPRTASALYTGLCLLADGVALDTDDRGDEPVGSDPSVAWRALDEFPRASWTQGARWRRRLSARGRCLVRAIETGAGLMAECVADYLMQHLAIDRGRDEVDDARRDPKHPSHGIPEHPDDYRWDRLPYHSQPGDLHASRGAPVHIALLHRAYRAAAHHPERWFDAVGSQHQTQDRRLLRRLR